MKRHIIRTASVAALAIISMSGLAACGSSSSSDTTVAATDSVVAGEITTEKMWARTTAVASTMGAAFGTITSSVDDTLLEVKVDPTIAAMAQMHEVVPVETDSSMMPTDSAASPDSTMAPEMTMQEVAEIPLKAGEPLVLKPGSYHIMLMKLVKPLETGTTIDLTLVFANAGEKVVTFTIQDDAP